MNRLFLNVGYELTEGQLRTYFSKFGVVSDMYLPKHTSGRNKGFGFATFATEDALLLALQTPQHVVDGIPVQVKRAGPRPVDARKEVLPAAVTASHVFGRGPRLYVGGVADAVTEERVGQHFGKWGNVTDVYFPGVKGQKRPNYCFVTFDNFRSSQRACDQSDRQIDGWPIESISIAEVRKNDVTQRPLDITHSSSSGLSDTTTSSPAAAAQQLAQLSTAAAGIPGYALWLQLQYQQALGKLSANDQAVAPYPMDTTHPDLVPTPCSPSMHSTTGSYTDISSAYLQSPGTTDAHHFDAASQPTAMNMPGWGGMPMASAAAGHMPSFAPQFPSICDQSLMASRAPLGGVQLLNSLTFGQTPLSGAAELGLSPAWGLNYSMPPQYHGAFRGDLH